MLTEADLRILSVLRTPMSITELSNTTDYSQSHVSERISHLEAWDLITTTQSRSKTVRVLHTPVMEAYRDLTIAHPHIDFPSLISPSMLRVCWFLDKPTAVRDITSRLSLRRRRIYQLLEQLQSRGLITKYDDQYALTDDLTGLARFAQTVLKHQHQHRTQTLLPTATVVWSAPQEALIATTDESTDTVQATFDDETDWHMTGLPRFADYGVELFTAGAPPYFYTDVRDALTPVDFILHTLVLEPDTRNLSYCALLLITADVSFEELRSTAPYYDVEDTVDALITFVETHGDTRREAAQLPDWEEMTSLAAQYGVTV